MEAQDYQERLKALPTKPGVYLMKDAVGNVLYVGKAANLRNRVRSYFGAPSGQIFKLQRMLSRVSDFEYIVTDSEQEAIILECTLIKKHRPHYNVRLRDDKSYPYLKITLDEEWPRIFLTRRFDPNRARYFGPFANAGSVRKTLDLLKRLFPYCSRFQGPTRKQARPCLDYYLHRCLGACAGLVTKEEYRQVIDQAILFLEGRQEEVLRRLRQQMAEAAEHLQFERAAILRDQIQAVEQVVQEQKVVSTALTDEDVIAFARERDQAWVEVFFVRDGKVVGRDHFELEGTRDEEPGQIVGSFVKQFYGATPYIPPRILLQEPVEDSAAIEPWLRSRRGSRVHLLVPRRGEKRRLVELVAQNAQEGLAQLKIRWASEAARASVLLELKEQLGLPRLPQRVECYDISDIRGTSAVGSMVVFENGQPKPAHYRRFRIKTVTEIDDYAMIREVLRRRFQRALAPTAETTTPKPGVGVASSWAILPDLVLIDGGRGHLSTALEVVRELKIDSLSLASLAKEKEEVFLPERAEPLVLPRHSPALYLLQRIRDEAHRFALAYHLKVRSHRSLESAMDKVPSIGPKRKRALLKRFGSLKAIKEANLDDIAAVVGMTRQLAERVKEYL